MSRMRFSVAGETRPRLCRTRSTVPMETPASWAIVLMVPMSVLLAAFGPAPKVRYKVDPG